MNFKPGKGTCGGCNEADAMKQIVLRLIKKKVRKKEKKENPKIKKD
jgi:hypothetical protein